MQYEQNIGHEGCKILTSRNESKREKEYILNGICSLDEVFSERIYEIKSILTESDNGSKKINIVKNLIDSSVISKKSYNLQEISVDEIEKLRENKKKAAFVLYDNGKFFYTHIPKTSTISMSTLSKEHRCSSCDKVSAASDENGGCCKVRSRRKRFEKFPCISKGFETINTKLESFIVLSCSQHEDYKPVTSLPIAQFEYLLSIGLV